MMIDQIHHGDCLDLMPLIPSGSVGMILCDLPYGTTKCAWDVIIPLERLWAEYTRLIRPNGAIVLTANFEFACTLRQWDREHLNWFKYDLVWDKNYGTAPGVAKHRPMPSHELILVFGKEKITYNPQMIPGGKPYSRRASERPDINGNEHRLGYGKNAEKDYGAERHPLSVQRFQFSNRPGKHPTEKPAEMFEWLIRSYSDPGDVVLDNCIGGGTTALAAINAGRRFIGIEKGERFVEMSRGRIREVEVLPEWLRPC